MTESTFTLKPVQFTASIKIPKAWPFEEWPFETLYRTNEGPWRTREEIEEVDAVLRAIDSAFGRIGLVEVAK